MPRDCTGASGRAVASRARGTSIRSGRILESTHETLAVLKHECKTRQKKVIAVHELRTTVSTHSETQFRTSVNMAPESPGWDPDLFFVE